MTPPLGLAHFQTAILRLPAVKRLLTDAMLTAQLRRRQTCFRLFQDPYDLLFRVSALAHLKSSSSGPRRPNLAENSHFRWTHAQDAAQVKPHSSNPRLTAHLFDCAASRCKFGLPTRNIDPCKD